MILFLVGWLTGTLTGALVVALVTAAGRKRAPAEPGRWIATCGQCAREQRQGPRTQLYVELWDSYGMMYEHYPVGVGEMLNTQPVGPWLTQNLRSAVERLNTMQQASGAGTPMRLVP